MHQVRVFSASHILQCFLLFVSRVAGLGFGVLAESVAF